LFTDVSRQQIGPIFEGQTVHEEMWHIFRDCVDACVISWMSALTFRDSISFLVVLLHYSKWHSVYVEFTHQQMHFY